MIALAPILTLFAFAQPAEPADTGDPFGADFGWPVCWVAPKQIAQNAKKRLGEAMLIASENTRPSAGSPIAEIKTGAPAEAKQHRCKAVVGLDLKALKGSKVYELDVSLHESDGADMLVTTTIAVDLAHLRAIDLEPAWVRIWKRLEPAATAPAPVAAAPSAPKAYVDDELRKETAAANTAPPPPPAAPRLATIWLAIGVDTRSIKDAPGNAIDESAVLSLGGDAALHAARFFDAEGAQTLDLEIGYARRLAKGTQNETKVGVNADRFDASALYRYRFGGTYVPSIGPEIGYELLRSEVDASARALSVRYGVIRAGLSARQAILAGEGSTLALRLDALLRAAPGSEGGSLKAGFDLGGAFELGLTEMIQLRARARWTHQAGQIAGASFTDSYLDLDLGLGVAL